MFYTFCYCYCTIYSFLCCICSCYYSNFTHTYIYIYIETQRHADLWMSPLGMAWAAAWAARSPAALGAGTGWNSGLSLQAWPAVAFSSTRGGHTGRVAGWQGSLGETHKGPGWSCFGRNMWSSCCSKAGRPMICGYSQQNWLGMIVYPGCIIISCVSFEDFFRNRKAWDDDSRRWWRWAAKAWNKGGGGQEMRLPQIHKPLGHNLDH